MRRVALGVLAATSGCWTGPVAHDPPVATATAAPRAQKPLYVRLVRETYTVEIDGRRRMARWINSDEDVGRQRIVHIRDEDLRALDRQITGSRFFERDENGVLPPVQQCTSDGTTTTCTLGTSISICSDAPRLNIMVSRGGQTHTIEHEYCTEDEVVGLARMIEQLTRSRETERE